MGRHFQPQIGLQELYGGAGVYIPTKWYQKAGYDPRKVVKELMKYFFPGVLSTHVAFNESFSREKKKKLNSKITHAIEGKTFQCFTFTYNLLFDNYCLSLLYIKFISV